MYSRVIISISLLLFCIISFKSFSSVVLITYISFICLILWIIDLYKPSIGLSVAVLVSGVADLGLLVKKKKDFNISYVTSIIGIIIGVYKICVL